MFAPTNFPPPIETPSVSPSSVGKKESKEMDKRVDQLGTAQLTQESTKPQGLETKTITKSPPSTGILEAIIKFFKRIFSFILDSEREQAKKIKELVLKVETDLTGSSLDDNGSLAQNALNLLRAQKETAMQLADGHSSFSSLPGQIESLEKRVRTAGGRSQLRKVMAEFDQSVKSYSEKNGWPEFIKFCEQRRALWDTLKQIINESPDFNKDPKVQQIANKPDETVSLYDVQELIHSLYPSETGQMDRLLNTSVKVLSERVRNLKSLLDDLDPLYEKYNQHADQIGRLERHLYSYSIFSRIYRVFNKPEKLERQLGEAREQLKQDYEAIKAKAGLILNEEVEWLKVKAKTNPRLNEVVDRLNKAQHAVAHLALRDRIGGQLSRLMEILNAKNTPSKYLKETEISHDYNKMMEELTANKEEMIKYARDNQLPADFNQLPLHAQIERLIPLAFPRLESRLATFLELKDRDAVKSNVEIPLAASPQIPTPPPPPPVETSRIPTPPKAPPKTPPLPASTQPPKPMVRTSPRSVISQLGSVTLNKTQTMPKPNELFEKRLKQIENREIKIDQIPKDEYDSYSQTQTVQLNMAGRRSAHKPEEGSSQETEENMADWNV